MLKYVSQFFLQIFPSVIATVVGAYIVNHYVIPKTGSDAPKTSAYSKATPGNDDDLGAIDVTPKPEAAAAQDSKSEAKGKPAEAAKIEPKTEPKSEASKSETNKTEPKRSAAREKSAIRVVLPGSAEPASAPAASTPSAATPSAAANASDEHRDRDANELARAAIERLRNTGAAEAARPAETPHVQDAVRDIPREPAIREPVRVNVVAVPPVQSRALVQPLPPPVNVMAPSADSMSGPVMQAPPPYAPPPRVVDANRLIPPADIPTASRPLDLQASAKTSVAEDVLSAARSVIHTIVPQ